MSIKPFTNLRSSKNQIDQDQHAELVRSSGAVAIGKVKQIIGTMGELRVFLQGSTDDETYIGNWVKVRYASPFMGFTQGNPLKGKDENQNKIENTKSAYGFSMIIPDIDNLVLCLFPESGDKTEGYWIGSISNNINNHAIPAHGSVSKDRISTESIPPEIASMIKSNGRYPVGEPPEIRRGPNDLNFVLDVKKPLNPELTVQYITQGLDSDIHRGVITTSSQRLENNSEPPSVFGFNSPGRKKSNDKNSRRLPGHSFVMDDGTPNGLNVLSRWRTGAGHQIMMNDNTGTIYLSNASGLSWVELTAQGDVLVFGARDFAVRTNGNIELHADKSIRMDANDIKMYAKNAINMESKIELTQRAEKTMALYSGEDFAINSGNNINVNSNGVLYMKSSGEMDLKGNKIHLNSSSGKAVSVVPTLIERDRYPDSIFDPKSGWAVQNDLTFSICNRVPTHEPYLRDTFEGYTAALKKAIEGAEAQKKYEESKARPKESTIDAVTKSGVGSLGNTSDTLAAASTSANNIALAAKAAGGTAALSESLKGKVPNIVPDAGLKNQPVPTGKVADFEPQETQALFAQIAYTESRGDYSAVNQFGYAGKYQMGAGALIDSGMLKPGTPQTVAAMQNPDNWIGGPGKPASLDEFLANEELQEKTMTDYTNRNYKTLKRIGVINDNSTKEEISGALAASHLVGPGGAKKFIVGGVDPADGNGTKASQYYLNGKTAITKAETIFKSDQAKQQLGA